MKKIIIMYLVFIFLSIKKMFCKHIIKDSFDNVLVIDLMGMGDIITLTPFLKILKSSKKIKKLSGCFPAHTCDLSKNFFELDSYLKHENYCITIKEIIKNRYDLIIIPDWGLRHSIIALFSKAVLLGFLNDLTFSNQYNNTFKLEAIGIPRLPVIYENKYRIHLSQIGNPILEYLGLETVKTTLIYKTEINNLDEYAVFHCSAKYVGRRWHINKFRDVANWLIDSGYVKKIYLVGSKDDIELYKKIETKFIISCAGKYDLLETKELISRARLFLGNDSGPMHIASYSGVPTYAIMGPNKPEISGTNSSLGHNFYIKHDCSPCNQRECKYDFKCIKAISSQMVISVLKKDLKKYYGS